MILVGVHDYDDGLHDDCTVITDNKICSSINTISRPGNSEEQAHSGLENDYSSGWNIGGHVFPPLAVDKVFMKPYWILPMTLNKKQRRGVHELCIEGTAFFWKFTYQACYIV